MSSLEMHKLKLAFEQGIIYTLDKLEEDKIITCAVREVYAKKSVSEFEQWYKTMAPLFALVGNGV